MTTARLADRHRALAHQLASRLLCYPDRELVEQAPLLREVAAALPAAVGVPLARFLDRAAGLPLGRLEAEYVETFDLTRRCCLYLSYFTHGDTRQRGTALLEFSAAYRSAGLAPPTDELPDHLAVVLEFSAAGDPEAAERLLVEHRAGLELLRLALAERDSAYRLVIDAVTATLPPPRPDDVERARRLALDGPPVEQVGLEPFAVAEGPTGRSDGPRDDLR